MVKIKESVSNLNTHHLKSLEGSNPEHSTSLFVNENEYGIKTVSPFCLSYRKSIIQQEDLDSEDEHQVVDVT